MKAVRKSVVGVFALALYFVVYSGIGTAGLYKWTDAQGNLHITDVPPPAAEKTPAPIDEPTPQASRPLPKQKTSVTPQAPAARKQAELAPVPGPKAASQSLKKLGQGAQVPASGLRPEQATVVSPWEVFDGKRSHAKAGVERWKDEQRVDHFSDVLPSENRGGG